MTATLRDRLRDETASLHAAAARALAATGCLSDPLPRAFLAFEARALSGFATDGGGASAGPDPEATQARRLHRRLRAALRADLGPDFPAICPGPVVPVWPTAYAYVMLGSGAGIGLLAPRWQTRGRFLALASGFGTDWAALAARLGTRPADGILADRILRDACLLFTGFIAAAEACPRTPAHG